jgi:hypothetical protein
MKSVASTLHTTSEHGVSSSTTADAHTSAASSRLNWRPATDLNGLVRFAERTKSGFSAVPSHFNWLLTPVEDSVSTVAWNSAHCKKKNRNYALYDLRLSPLCKRDPRSLGITHSIQLYFFTDVSGEPSWLIFKGRTVQECIWPLDRDRNVLTNFHSTLYKVPKECRSKKLH